MTRRSTVDYALRKRAVLADVRAGRVALAEVCDATPQLVQAARHHGEGTEETCPVCRRWRLTRVNYVYGDALGTVAGQAKRERELARMDAAQDEFAVHAVEVCRGCGWNHLALSYVLGAVVEPGRAPRRPGRRSAPD
ncbi:hypothetical protein SAMN05660199_03553 [Klenkia soli]|uniref:DUF5318 domain-containing protein n=1 Tax=Klenkia soli TaxID=1052260 RepID=A0A1H0RDR9_9ACTN|nr:DUF5318 family protein [Klenkia soli]SDP27684.1 hypothetical protein SAMN05660199_03553 [Klenkia soli]